jgi:hypothetical protein
VFLQYLTSVNFTNQIKRAKMDFKTEVICMAKTIETGSEYERWKSRRQERKMNEDPAEEWLRQALLEIRQELQEMRQEIRNLKPLPVGPKGGRPSSRGGVHRVDNKRRDGTIVTYWYAHRGGPRISEEEARRIIAAAHNKVVPFTKPAP